jgi:hypothetical protein
MTAARYTLRSTTMASRFGEAARKGIGAHGHAEAARREMNDVLRLASADLTETLGTAVELSFDQRERPSRAPSLLESASGTPAPRVKFDALTASSRSRGSRSAVLAEVKFSALGFPVEVRFADQWEIAQDRDAFERVLIDLLEHPATGEMLAAIVPAGDASVASA